ncbi:hypothetical protein IV203_007302 [Nitzschia inconspicua]|uniref:Uncharacterized protein n=1 Tax=Nitzschia inconspicua TaxID=303405 RepID=A0A9K3KFK7_9STRA|nr:hypothetical protein IV203_007302 [Nitzschia inconspicua]
MVLTSPRNRRRGRSPTKEFASTDAASAVARGDNTIDEDSPVELLDEDEQKALVDKLKADAAAQSRFFQRLYGYGIGGFATIFSLCFPLLCPDECHKERVCWIHAVYSSLTHVWTVHPFLVPSTKSQLYRWNGIISLIVQVIPWLIWMFGTAFLQDEDQFHLGLMIGNLVTYLGSFLIDWDMNSTNRALKELDDAQYKHKAL